MTPPNDEPTYLRESEIRARIRDVSPEAQRRIALAAVRYAFSRSDIQDHAEDVLTALKSGSYGDSKFRDAVQAAYKRAEIGTDDAAEAGDRETALALARHAGALGASHRALDADPEKAAIWAVHQARNMTTGFEVDTVILPILNDAEGKATNE